MSVNTPQSPKADSTEAAKAFIDDIAVLTPYTRVTKEATRKLAVLFEQREQAARIDEIKRMQQSADLYSDMSNSCLLVRVWMPHRIAELISNQTPKKTLHDIVNDDEAIRRAVELSIEDQKSISNQDKTSS